MYVYEVKEQNDERFTIIYRDDDGKMVVQPNAAVCFNGSTHDYEGDKILTIHFEVTEVNVVK